MDRFSGSGHLLTAACRLDEDARTAVGDLAGGAVPKIRMSTTAEIHDVDGVPVCTGRFDWSVRLTTPAGPGPDPAGATP